ncbi:hypothetical protein ACFL1D_00695 [Candidatus Omnitrophota bacterium]
MRKIKEVIRMVYGFYRKRQDRGDSPCPDEEMLACFSEGKLSKSESKEIQGHLLSCSRCAEVVSLLYHRLGEEKTVPEFLIQNAKGLLAGSSPPNILKVILALKEKAIQILKTSGDIILDNEIMPLPVLRSRKISDFTEDVKLIKKSGDLEISMLIQKQDKDRVRLNLNLLDKASLLPAEGLRLTLFRNGEETESYEAVFGKAMFDNLGIGRYVIEISRQQDKLGTVDLEIR